MKVVQQTIRIKKIYSQVYTVQTGYKLKSFLMDPSTDIAKLNDFIARNGRSQYIDDNKVISLSQDQAGDEPIIEVSVNYQFSDGSNKDVIVWDNLKGFHKEDYEEAKRLGLQIDKVLERNQHIVKNG